MSSFVSTLGARYHKILDAACPPDGRRGLWILDKTRNAFFLSIQHRESSIQHHGASLFGGASSVIVLTGLMEVF
ncbi:MAG: hypothetical protein JRJ50_02810 [Deltaproteobacteria bacterium]|nr:hypothetical protein [Deltaproteobacteria bacterium]MBW2032386.1 hypothetical protein [Deltaproteobacteria bacterium]MBW2113601.1 hypothetical protein [Deltaproteobacteria bacterium]